MTNGNSWEDNDWNGWAENQSSGDWNQPQRQQSFPSAQERSPRNDTWKSSERDDDDVRVVRGVDGTNKVKVWKTFQEVRQHFPGGLVDILTDGKVASFTKPTAIQAFTWPSLMAGEDIIGIAKTGSGKTLAFLLPGFIRIKQTNHDGYNLGPKICVLAPTRELCQQIYEESEKFGEPAEIYSACAYGGADKMPQLRKFRSGPHVAIACPGRLTDYLKNGQVKLRNADYFVLDEADRMLDMGFEPQIREILSYVPDQRQSLMFSATWPRDVQNIARAICYKDSVHIQVGTSDALTANKDITQYVMFVTGEGDKWQELKTALQKVLGNGRSKNVALVFTQTKRGCATLAKNVQDYMHYDSTCLHGDMDQPARDRALRGFKDGRFQVMIATDVAQRGLDIRNAAAVINWDVPSSIEDYVHRIGRTGRAGEKGVAYTFMKRDETHKANDIVKLMQKAGQEVPADLLQAARGFSVSSSYGKGGKR